MSITLFFVASSVLSLAASLPSSRAQSPTIDWENIQARYPTFTPWTPGQTLPDHLLERLLHQSPISSERYPGYKKGSKSFANVCGVVKDTKIVGGEEAPMHSFPWMAALFVDNKWFCGGTLISDEWVLTAAHCAKDASSMIVMLGAHNVRETEEEGRLELTTTEFFTHPDYSTFTHHNDLALVHLPQAINFTDMIKPVCLPHHSESGTAWDHMDVTASGWGKPTDESTSISPVLRFVELDTITNLMCALEYPTVINKNIICISGKDGKSTCNGDSGGPLYLIDSATSVHKQIGITSFGSSIGCEKGWHAGFTRTSSFLEWIETETNVMIEP